MNNLSNRCIAIIRILLEEEDFIYANNLSKRCHTSIRTTRYDLEQIRDWMESNNLQLLSIPNKGIKIEESSKAAVKKALKNRGSDYFFSAEERVNYLISYLLSFYKGETIEQLAEKMDVSKNTVLRDLTKVENWFKKHGSKLLRKQRKGILLEATESQRRKLIVEYIIERQGLEKIISCHAFNKSEINNNIDNDSDLFYSINKTVNLEKIIENLDYILKENMINISDASFVYLVYFAAVQEYQIKQNKIVEDNGLFAVDDKLKKRVMYWFDNKFKNTGLEKFELELEKKYFLSIYLGYVQNNFQIEKENHLTEEIYELIVNRVFQLTHCDISYDQDLKKGMILHIDLMLNRIKYNIPYKNVVLDDIKRMYPDSFNMCMEIFDEIEKIYNIEKNESEIGFISLYVNQALERIYKNKNNFRHTNALLICSQGLATVSFLVKSIQENFNNIQIIDKISAFKASTYDYSNVDLILSTINLPFTVLKPVLKVSPMLTKRDIAKIENFLDKNEFSQEKKDEKEMLVDTILETISKHYDIEDNERIKKDIHNIFFQDTSDLPSLYEVMGKEFFVANIEADDWEDAVIKAAEPLIKNKMIDSEYLNEIIEIKNELGQYAVIANGICMPHASPNERNKLSMSLATLKDPIMVEVNRNEAPIKIKVMMVLAINDNVRYAKALDEAFTLFKEYPNLADMLSKAKTSKELIDIIKTCYDKVEW
ncbi:MAG: BglG family transcription antiterminator [Erysipelotrichaceae bacterium]